MPDILLVFFIISFPVVMQIAAKKNRFLEKIGPVTLCYGTGFLISLFPPFYNKMISQTVASVLIATAIPLILCSFDIRSAKKLTEPVAKGFSLLILSVVLVSSTVSFFGSRYHSLPFAGALGGMCMGLYIGGTPNLVAVGNVLLPENVKSAVIAAVGTADFIVGGIYILLAYSVLPAVFKKFFKDSDVSDTSVTAEVQYGNRMRLRSFKDFIKSAMPPVLSFALLGIGVVVEIAINGNMDGSAWILVTVSLGGILLGLIPQVRSLPNSRNEGEYLVLVFCLGLGLSMDPEVFVASIVNVLIYCACSQILVLFLHAVLCKIFKVDGGSAFITGIAGVYGPPFIAPAASSYGRPDLIAPGIVCAVFGLAIGNFIGIPIGYLLSEIVA